MIKEHPMYKREWFPIMYIYILFAKVSKGEKIACYTCGRTTKLTFHHDKYYDHTIDDMRLFCWKHHMQEEGKVSHTDRKMVGVNVIDGWVHCRRMKFKLYN